MGNYESGLFFDSSLKLNENIRAFDAAIDQGDLVQAEELCLAVQKQLVSMQPHMDCEELKKRLIEIAGETSVSLENLKFKILDSAGYAVMQYTGIQEEVNDFVCTSYITEASISSIREKIQSLTVAEHLKIELLQRVDAHVEAVEMRFPEPVGIRNKGGTDCWISSIMQLIANARVDLSKHPSLDGFVRQYMKDQHLKSRVAQHVDTQAIRSTLGHSGHDQVDPAELFEKILDQCGLFLSMEAVQEHRDHEGRLIWTDRLSTDSHLSLPTISFSMDQLLPFQKAIENGVDVVMIGHLLVPELDGAHPASLSPILIEEWLRHKLNFQGLVLPDALNMGGAD